MIMGSQAQNYHADSHADVGESLFLTDKSAAQGHKRIGKPKPDDGGAVRVYAKAADHVLIVTGSPHGKPVAGMEK